MTDRENDGALGDDRWESVPPSRPDEVRKRGYFTGHALGRILDDLRPAWRSEIDHVDLSLDGMLSEVLRARGSRGECELDAGEMNRLRSDARRLVAVLGRDLAGLRARAVEREGWLLEFEAPREAPLRPEGFDPLNIHRVSRNEIVHTRWIRVSSATATVEVREAPSLTEGAGDHPLAGGVRRLRVVSDVEPRIERTGKVVAVGLEHVTARLISAVVERHGRRITFRLAAQGP